MEMFVEAIEFYGAAVVGARSAQEAASQLAEIDVVQPTLFALQVALAALWRSWGVAPDAVVGHSMGEVAAAYVAGALGLEDAARVICMRSRLLRRLSGRGGMAVVGLSLAETARALSGYERRVSIAGGLGDYCFVIDLEGHVADEVVADCLRDLHAQLADVKFLGSYPAAGERGAVIRREADQAWKAADTWIASLRRQVRS